MEEEQRIKLMRKQLEGWREVLVGLHSVLTWEKQYFPICTGSAITLFFLLLWYLDLPILVLISVFGIVITILDYLIPQVVPMICNTNQWTGSSERKYEQIVSCIAGCFDNMNYTCIQSKNFKANNSKLYFVLVITMLTSGAWIGSIINNFFLLYITVLFLFMLPGLRKQEMFKKYCNIVTEKVASVLRKYAKTSKPTDTEKKKE